MKFGRYLEETQIPEWKKAYIDYRGLKKRINSICAAQEEDGSTPLLLATSPALDTHPVETHTGRHPRCDVAPPVSARDSLVGVSQSDYFDTLHPHSKPSWHDEHDEGSSVDLHEDDVTERSHSGRPLNRVLMPQSPEVAVLHPPDHTQGSTAAPPGGLLRAATLNMGFLPRLRGHSLSRAFWEPSRNAGKQALKWDLAKSIPLRDLMPLLLPLQRAYFEKLDSELDKIESFYVEREKEMRARVATLRIQLRELQDHGRVFHEAQGANTSWLPLVRRKLGNGSVQGPSGTPSRGNESEPRKRRIFRADNGSPKRKLSPPHNNEAEDAPNHTRSSSPERSPTIGTVGNGTAQSLPASAIGSEVEDAPKGWKKVRYNMQRIRSPGSPGSPRAQHKYDPDEYMHAKKRLKKAVLECYRGLEALENYRTLNLIGFRKALKKFEKGTKIPAQQAYFLEKIEPCAFSSGDDVQGMLSELEDSFAARFTQGDQKLAKTRLRGDAAQHKTRHISTFRSGLMLGLAIPALADGVYRSFQHDTRQAIPAYNGLYYVFSVFLIPVLFSFLVGINVLVWSRFRINYVFIFEFDVKSKLDAREYFEFPAIFLSTLCYAFWLSFAHIGTPHFSPTLWPLIWLAFATFMLLNPFPIFWKPARWWLLRNWFRLLTSGVHRVEFADFWMGDQFCSLVFTLSNLYFVVCAYDGGLNTTWTRCLSPRPWGVPFVLASLPLLARFVQSIKRYVDSKLVTHLINGGKYGAGIIYYLFYFNWRHHGGSRGGDFALWITFGIIYATYSSAWDFLMDWSVLRPRAKHPFLRDDLVYTNSVPMYYFAIVSNVLIRFIWMMYIPEKGPSFAVRTFVAGMLEMLRRWQWNFYRLENEHLGNMDQYRVTREVPLPYSFEDQSHDDDDDDRKSIASWRSRRKATKTQVLRDSPRAGDAADVAS